VGIREGLRRKDEKDLTIVDHNIDNFTTTGYPNVR
jgi:hypothetical protein